MDRESGERWRGKEKDGEEGPDNMSKERPQGGGQKKRRAMWTRPAAGCVHNNNVRTRLNSIRFSGHTTAHVTTYNNNLK